jgi:alanyl-tRNA synthetase
MSTARLYHDDAYLRRFEATVVAHASHRERAGVVLDRSAFYPEAGGQLGDRGSLAGATVVDTQELDDGRIVHVVDGELPSIGSAVAGELDWARRRQHMAQHTAQHLLSGTLLDRAAAATASARLGETALTIDVTRDRIPEAELAAAEQLANDLIDDDLAIRAWFPAPDELASLKLRRDPKVTESIRIVAIGEFDLSPCGGTHCARTSQLAAIHITGVERYKGMTRVTFTAGRRGRAELLARDQILRGLAAQFSCSPADVGGAIDKLRREAEAASAETTAMRGRLATQLATSLAADGTGAVVAALPADPNLLRAVAARLVAAGRDALLASSDEAGTTVALFRAAGSTLDCGALWKTLQSRAGGRGGGRADRAEGRLATRIEDWNAAIAEAIG